RTFFIRWNRPGDCTQARVRALQAQRHVALYVEVRIYLVTQETHIGVHHPRARRRENPMRPDIDACNGKASRRAAKLIAVLLGAVASLAEAQLTPPVLRFGTPGMGTEALLFYPIAINHELQYSTSSNFSTNMVSVKSFTVLP